MNCCEEGCPICLDSPVEEFVEAIQRHNPEGVCIEHDGVCERVPCCKTKPSETADEPGW